MSSAASAARGQPVVAREAGAVDDPDAGERDAALVELARTTTAPAASSRAPRDRAPSCLRSISAMKLSLSRSSSGRARQSGEEWTSASARRAGGALPACARPRHARCRRRERAAEARAAASAGSSTVRPSTLPRSTIERRERRRLVLVVRGFQPGRGAARVEVDSSPTTRPVTGGSRRRELPGEPARSAPVERRVAVALEDEAPVPDARRRAAPSPSTSVGIR